MRFICTLREIVQASFSASRLTEFLLKFCYGFGEKIYDRTTYQRRAGARKTIPTSPDMHPKVARKHALPRKQKMVDEEGKTSALKHGLS